MLRKLYSCLFFLIVARAEIVLRHVVKRGADISSDIKMEYAIKKVETPLEKFHIIKNLENRIHCLDPKPEYNVVLANGLLCEPITTVYILKSNIYSCYDLYLPVWFYGFQPDVATPSNMTSTFREGFLNKGYGSGKNGSDAIQKEQKKTDECILYMR
jgi:hypothetical protein